MKRTHLALLCVLLSAATGGAYAAATSAATTKSTYTCIRPPWSTATLASSATIGAAPISITNAQGTGTSAATFQVTYGSPAIASLYPTAGPVGTPVVILGSYLGYPGTTLTLNGQSITLASQSTSQSLAA